MSENKELINSMGLIDVNINEKNFNLLMDIYKTALDDVYGKLVKVKEIINNLYGHDVINSITKRIKTHNSIINKMKKKNCEIDLKNMIENINDIAGIRISCPIKSDIYNVIEIIDNISDIRIIERKDYINNPKRSGYSGYHLIIETLNQIEGKDVPVKVEIQIRTMAMDFWATNEHKVRYKSNKKLSIIDSKKLTAYAKIINIIDDKIMEIYNKQELA